MATQTKTRAVFNPRDMTETGYSGLNGSLDGRSVDRPYSDTMEFLRAAGHDHKILKRETYWSDGNSFQKIPDQYSLIRSTDLECVSAHTVTGQYQPFSLLDLSEELQPWTNGGFMEPDSVLATPNGNDILCFRMANEANDSTGPIKLYFSVELPHGTGKGKGRLYGFRVVCANTLAAMLGTAAEFAFGHRVSRNDTPEEKAKTLQERVQYALAGCQKLQEAISRLATVIPALEAMPMTASEAKDQAMILFGAKPKPDGTLPTATRNRIDDLLAEFNRPEMGTFGRSAWDFANAATAWSTSPKARRDTERTAEDRYLASITEQGSGRAFESRLASQVYALAGLEIA